MSLHDAVRAVAVRRPDACAILDTGGDSVTYAGLVDLVDRLSGGLAARGVRAGDCVAFALRNSIDYVALILATANLGAHYVPLLTGFDDVDVKEALHRTRPVLLVADRDVPTELPTVDVERLRASEPRRDTDVHTGVFRILWTSGSTGFPKRIAWRQDRFVTERRRWIADTGIRDTDVFFCRHTLDVAHATDLHVFAALLAGARLVLADPGAPAAELLGQLVEHGATAMSALPRHYEDLVEAAPPGTDLSRLRRAMCGGAYLSPAVVRKAERTLGVTIREVYGSTEFGLALGDMSGTGLVPVAGVGVRIEPLPDSSDTGELVLRSGCTSEGYLDNPEANARTFRGAEFWTGDIATRHGHGYRILGRLTDAVATRRGPVFAPMLDEEITADGAVVESVSLPVRVYGDEVVVVARPADPAGPALTRIRSVLAAHGLRGTVELVDAIPRTEVGKVDKPLLRNERGMS